MWTFVSSSIPHCVTILYHNINSCAPASLHVTDQCSHQRPSVHCPAQARAADTHWPGGQLKPIVDMISPASVSRYLLCHIIQHIYCLDIHTAALCRDSGQLPSECTQASPALVTGKQERIILVFCTFSILTVTCSLMFYQTVETHSLLHSMLQ